VPYPRIRFSDGATLWLDFVIEYEQEAFEARWRAVHVHVDWFRSPRGRLDPALRLSERYVTWKAKRGEKLP
jgi:hypothetical protein